MSQEGKLQSIDILGVEKENYLSKLEKSLLSVSNSLRGGMTQTQKETINNFAKENDWDFDRLPDLEDSHKTTADLIDRIIQDYKWFSWDNKNKDPIENKGYFKKLGISISSGLPWVFDLVTLERLKKESKEILKEIPEYQKSALALKNVLLQDYIEIDDVKRTVKNYHEEAMKRNFLEKLNKSELIGWEQNGKDIKINSKKTIDLGGETLWNLSFIKYSAAYNMFEAYVVDLWQDNLGRPHIEEIDEGIKMSDKLISNLGRFSVENPAYFVLEELDEKFETLHPVHISKSLIGPYENKYMKMPRFNILPGIKEYVLTNPDEGALRFCKSYFYAPNHRDIDGKTRQILGKRENWNEQIVVCPSSYSKDLSKDLLGTDLKIIAI
jgi:hypothetical protein